MQLRDYQQENAEKLRMMLVRNKCAYFVAEMRTGKTITALHVATLLMGEQPTFRVLFITKKGNPADSVKADIEMYQPDYYIEVINYESCHKVDTHPRWDLIITDEANEKISSYPKQSENFKKVHNLFDEHTHHLLLSGSPHPESMSQLFHQFQVGYNGPFADFGHKKTAFYQWAKEYVNVTKKEYRHGIVNDYSDAKKEEIMDMVGRFMLTFTQKQAGFEIEVNERREYCTPKESTTWLVKKLMKDRVYEGKTGAVILADSVTKLRQKVHQITSGTIITDNKGTVELDTFKVDHIKREYAGKKIAIFYKYVGEYDMLNNHFPNNTKSDQEFNASNDMVFLGQMTSNRSGVNLMTADTLIYFNVDDSCTTYIQGRQRLSNLKRTKPIDVVFLLTIGGIDEKIYNIVSQQKANYSNAVFLKDFGLGQQTQQMGLF